MQPDYILVCAKERGIFKGVGFHFPWFLHLDHHAIVRVVRAGRGGAAEAVPAQVPEVSTVPAAGAKGCRFNGIQCIGSQVH